MYLKTGLTMYRDNRKHVVIAVFDGCIYFTVIKIAVNHALYGIKVAS